MDFQEELFRYEKYEGQEAEVCLPVLMCNKPMGIIGMKAFLSCKTVEKLVLPESLVQVEDWAFAHMRNLQELVLPAKQIHFGKKVFLGCDSLRRVDLHNVEGYDGIPFFLANAFRFLEEEALFDLEQAGDMNGQWEWLSLYDEKLMEYIKRPDEYGFVPAFIGWFDVEDVDDQKDGYVLSQRKNKVLLVFQRLIYSAKIESDVESFLQEYLLRNEELIMEVLREESYGKDIRYYKAWKQAGGLESDTCKEILAWLPNDEPEIKAYLLEITLEDTKAEDYFKDLEL